MNTETTPKTDFFEVGEDILVNSVRKMLSEYDENRNNAGKYAAQMKHWRTMRDATDRVKLEAFVKAVRDIEIPDLGTLTTERGKELVASIEEHLDWVLEKAEAL